ncbi:unnamed protein product [Staurois parvus]|uniref:Uncharacterized protein n=1 Tax=Staurois parvus TaxID=386267 RepID=A0ABN9EZB1_9NEOB|nr:unnamed protein product [Staurois parvus]
MGPCTGLPLLLVSIATLCHVPLSGLLTLLVGFPFCIWSCMASLLLLPISTPRLWLHTPGFLATRDCPNE